MARPDDHAPDAPARTPEPLGPPHSAEHARFRHRLADLRARTAGRPPTNAEWARVFAIDGAGGADETA